MQAFQIERFHRVSGPSPNLAGKIFAERELDMQCSLRGLILLLLLLAALAWNSAAHATVIGNPAPDIASGQFGLGLGLSDNRETLFADIGLSDAGTLQILFGNVEFGPSTDGSEVGVGYRHKIMEAFNLGDQPVRLGILGTFRLGESDDPAVDLEFRQIDVGFGGAFTPVEKLNAFAVAIYRRIDVEGGATVNPAGKVTGFAGDDTDIGVVVGAEFWLAENGVLGVELHVGFDDDDFAIFGEVRF